MSTSSVSSSQPSLAIEENSIFQKITCCTPIIGNVLSIIQENALANKINDCLNDIPTVITLIQIKNEYKVANIVQNLLCAALVISGIALGILGKTLILSTLPYFGFAGLKMYEIYQNRKLIEELRQLAPSSLSDNFEFGRVI